MFDDILLFVGDKNLPFYWDRECNLFGNLSVNQMNALQGNLMQVGRKLKSARANGDWKVLSEILRK